MSVANEAGGEGRWAGRREWYGVDGGRRSAGLQCLADGEADSGQEGVNGEVGAVRRPPNAAADDYAVLVRDDRASLGAATVDAEV